ncbi:conserved hypothetical protein, partial [Ricinus communis]
MQYGRTVSGGALTKAIPVVDDLDALRVSGHDGGYQSLAFVRHEQRDPVRKKNAGGRSAPTVGAEAKPVRRQMQRMLVGAACIRLGKDAAETIACNGAVEKGGPLVLATRNSYRFQHMKMRLQYLCYGRICFREDGNNLGENAVRNIDAA